MFDGFTHKRIRTSGAEVALMQGGSGSPLLLVHGCPQTHAMWHKVAPELAKRFTVIAPDLRGYGASSKPAGDPEHLTYSKRAMAQDLVEVMAALGFERFDIAWARSRRAGHVSPRARSSRASPPYRRARYYPDARTIRADGPVKRARRISLVLPRPTGTFSREFDRQGPGLLPGSMVGVMVPDARRILGRGARRISRGVPQSRNDSRHMRGLSRGYRMRLRL